MQRASPRKRGRPGDNATVFVREAVLNRGILNGPIRGWIECIQCPQSFLLGLLPCGFAHAEILALRGGCALRLKSRNGRRFGRRRLGVWWQGPHDVRLILSGAVPYMRAAMGSPRVNVDSGVSKR